MQIGKLNSFSHLILLLNREAHTLSQTDNQIVQDAQLIVVKVVVPKVCLIARPMTPMFAGILVLKMGNGEKVFILEFTETIKSLKH